MLNQAVDQAGYDVEDRSRAHVYFSHLYTGLDYSGFRKHLGITNESVYKPNPVPRKNLPHLKELVMWLFGSKTENKLPVVRSQDPDLKRLDAILTDNRALHALRSGLGLDVAYQLSLNEDVRIRERLVRFRYDLQQTKGLALDGYGGDTDLLETAEAIKDLASALFEEIGQNGSPKSTETRARLKTVSEESTFPTPLREPTNMADY